MTARSHEPVFRKIDCLQVPVPDLGAGLAFYRDRLGHELLWRTASQAGLRLPDTDAELVLQVERAAPDVNLLVASVADADGTVIGPPNPQPDGPAP